MRRGAMKKEERRDGGPVPPSLLAKFHFVGSAAEGREREREDHLLRQDFPPLII